MFWYNDPKESLPFRIRSMERCLIFGDNFKDHGLGKKYGFNPSDHTIRVLLPQKSLGQYRIDEDPETFSALYSKEKILAEDPDSLIRRITVQLQLIDFLIFEPPDPKRHVVIVFPKNTFSIEENDPCVLFPRGEVRNSYSYKRRSALDYLEQGDLS